MLQILSHSRIILNTLLIIEITMGLAIIAVTGVYHWKLSTFLVEADEKMLSSTFFNVYILGFQLAATFVCGISIWAIIWPHRYSKNIQLLLTIWLIFCFLIVFCGCATIWTMLANANNVSKGAEAVLLKGIDIYYMNPEWKLLWDRMQYEKECCGVHGYQDWMHAAWLSDTLKDDSGEHKCEQAQYGENADYMYSDNIYSNSDQILAPYACCKRSSTLCYKSYMPHIRKDGTFPTLTHLNLTDINTEGCLPLFTRDLAVGANIAFILILVAAFIDILICCCTRYIMSTNYKRHYEEFDPEMCMCDDEGNSLVVIKCPPKVKCITLEERDPYCGFDMANTSSSSKVCPC